MNKFLDVLKKNRIEGFTLIEIIVSIAIIGIMVVSFLTIFTNSFSTIFSMGHKTESVNEAQAFIETVYQEGLDDIDVIASTFNSTKEDVVTNMNSSLYDPSGSNKQIFHNVDTSGTHDKVTVMVFYQNGNRHVKLSALVP